MRRGVIAALTLAVPLAGCSASKRSSEVPSALPPLPATSVLGYTFEQQKSLDAKFASSGASSLISSGRLYTIRKGTVLEGSYQITVFKKDVDGQDPKVQDGILDGLGAGGRGFQTLHYGLTKLHATSTGETILYVWFPAHLNAMELFVLRSGFADAGKLVPQVIADQLHYPNPPEVSTQ